MNIILNIESNSNDFPEKLLGGSFADKNIVPKKGWEKGMLSKVTNKKWWNYCANDYEKFIIMFSEEIMSKNFTKVISILEVEDLINNRREAYVQNPTLRNYDLKNSWVYDINITLNLNNFVDYFNKFKKINTEGKKTYAVFYTNLEFLLSPLFFCVPARPDYMNDIKKHLFQNHNFLACLYLVFELEKNAPDELKEKFFCLNPTSVETFFDLNNLGSVFKVENQSITINKKFIKFGFDLKEISKFKELFENLVLLFMETRNI